MNKSLSEIYVDEDSDSLSGDQIKRIERMHQGKIKVHFSTPVSLAKLITEDDLPSFYNAFCFTLRSSSNDNDSISLSRSIPFGELIKLKTFILALNNESIKKDSRGMLKQLTSVIELVINGKDRKVGYLRNMPAAVYAFLIDGYIDGWLYKINRNGDVLPYLITNVEYRNPLGVEQKPYVSIEMICHSKGERSSLTFTVDSNDIRGRTISEVFYSEKGLLHESKELKERYDDSMKNFMEFQSMHYAQFKITGEVDIADGWRQKSISVTEGNSKFALAVNDEPSKEHKILNFEASNSFWTYGFDADEDSFVRIPMHPFIHMFHLGKHMHIYISSRNMSIYEYNKKLEDKLVLPESHKELIEILTSDQDVLMEDTIQGKGGGTIILCQGIPGVGKTLSAQVYSEIMEKPLYSVNAGQLGVSIEKVEENLKDVMSRAERWNAVLLIDEADVYIRKRGGDVHHNALVAVWLRTLEYFDGLMFLTTNRGDDVDDAISSRCIATISYKAPELNESIKIWKIMGKNAGVEISEEMAVKLSTTFPKAVGRDIEKLVKLTVRYTHKKGINTSLDSFIHCAAFRGMISSN